MTNVFAPSKKAPAKLKFACKSKPATPLPPTGALLGSRTRGSKRKTTPHLVLAVKQRVSYLLKYLLTFLWLTLLTPFFFLSKHKEDLSVTCPILLDEPGSEVHLLSSLPFLFFAYASSATCLLSASCS